MQQLGAGPDAEMDDAELMRLGELLELPGDEAAAIRADRAGRVSQAAVEPS
jgi:hypothetical protein